MTRLIRNYQSGSQIVLSDHLRHHLAKGGNTEIGDAELARRLRQQAEERLAEAEQVLAAAQRQAEKIVQEAEEEQVVARAAAQAAGYEEGYTQGVAEGRAVGEQMHVEGIEEVQAVLAQLSDERARLLLDAEHETATLALAVAEKVIGGLARTNRELIIHTVNRALSELAITGPFALRVHPTDAAYLEQAWQAPQAVEDRQDEQSWKLIPDPHIAPGGCVVLCGPSSVDARLSSQLRTIVNGLALSDYRLQGEEGESGAGKDAEGAEDDSPSGPAQTSTAPTRNGSRTL